LSRGKTAAHFSGSCSKQDEWNARQTEGAFSLLFWTTDSVVCLKLAIAVPIAGFLFDFIGFQQRY
jgi:hypothetical protein